MGKKVIAALGFWTEIVCLLWLLKFILEAEHFSTTFLFALISAGCAALAATLIAKFAFN